MCQVSAEAGTGSVHGESSLVNKHGQKERSLSSAKAKEELATQLDKASPQSSHPGHQVSGKLIHPVLHRHLDTGTSSIGRKEAWRVQRGKTSKPINCNNGKVQCWVSLKTQLAIFHVALNSRNLFLRE